MVAARGYQVKQVRLWETVCGIERGHANPKWDTVKLIAVELGLSVSKLARLAEKLAQAAGITPNMLSLIERGEGNPSWVTLRGIAKALGVSVAELAKLAEKYES